MSEFKHREVREIGDLLKDIKELTRVEISQKCLKKSVNKIEKLVRMTTNILDEGFMEDSGLVKKVSNVEKIAKTIERIFLIGLCIVSIYCIYNKFEKTNDKLEDITSVIIELEVKVEQLERIKHAR